MATALRCLAKAVLVRKSAESVVAPCVANGQVYVRNYKSSSSTLVTRLDVSKLPDFEVSKDPKEWQFVERLIPLTIVPQPIQTEGRGASGWVPPKPKGKTHPYFVPRNKNHMQPVYLKFSHRGQRQITIIRKIQGDIWQMEKDLKKFLESKLPTNIAYRSLASCVNEMCGNISFRGDYVEYVKLWMNKKGF